MLPVKLGKIVVVYVLGVAECCWDLRFIVQNAGGSALIQKTVGI